MNSLFHEADFEGRDVVEASFSNDSKIGGFQAFDYFRDGSFYVLNVPGHTIGHVGALVRTTPDSQLSNNSYGALSAHVGSVEDGNLTQHTKIYTVNMKVALVTASSAGLGAAIAKVMVFNVRVVINYSSNASRAEALIDELHEVASRSKAPGSDCEGSDSTNVDSAVPRAVAFRADLGKRSDIEDLVSAAIKTYGRLDVVVSNGGWTRIRKFNDLDDNMDEDDWDKCFNINVKAHMWLMKVVRPHLEATEGAFITVASVAGVKPSGSSVPYAVTKAAQIHLVKCLARIMSPKVRVNSVSPSILMTDWGRQFPEESLNIAKEATLLKRFATVEDVADQVRLLALSPSITSQNIVIDAGFST
ncbi:hypothetical protein H2200_012411 [Cladophialophora chaetospira]|uniref:Uncharacterized protein n=1 Tax=Cladophialophora chaetospira TaxID=386627 RepID=A0AA38WXS2_9EURO|nr:hypothetical protein H2200_012411 [Cladophialophora chaetospira]